MSFALQTNGDFKGDNLSVNMFDGAGDGITIFDAMVAGVNLTSATANFVADDLSKIINIVGAGVAGAPFQTTIASIVSSTAITLTDSAPTSVGPVQATWGSDNTNSLIAAINNGATSGGIHLAFPAGIYLFTGNITIQDVTGIHFEGRGPTSVLMPSASLTENFITLLGCSDVDIHDLCIDGSYYPDISKEIINGDGSVANPLYGNVKVRNCYFNNCKPIVLGLGANAGKTAQDIVYEHNRFYSCGAGSFLPNTIDTGSAGTKLRYRIQHNQFSYVTQPSSTSVAGVAIFAGHGTNIDFNISHNVIENCPIDGIQIFNRPFTNEATKLSNFLIANNIIRQAGWAGVSIYGGTNIRVLGNNIINPGFAMDGSTSFRRAAIAISNQITGVSTNVAVSNLSIQNNNLVDDQLAPSMQYAIVESVLGGANTSGTLAHNMISGTSIAPFQVNGVLGIIHPDSANDNVLLNTSARLGINTAATLQVPFNIHTHSINGGAFSGLFNEMSTKAANFAGNFLLTYAYNAKFDGTNWVSGADGTSNGFVVIAGDYGSSRFRVYTVPSTGGTPQTVSPATLETHLAFSSSDTAFMIPNLSASKPVKTDVTKTLISAAIDLSAGDVTGILGHSHLDGTTLTLKETTGVGTTVLTYVISASLINSFTAGESLSVATNSTTVAVGLIQVNHTIDHGLVMT